VVLQDEAWAAFVPFAASSACEVWLAPREHGADFGRLGRDQAGALGLALQRLLRALARALDDPDYNLMIHSWPVWMADAPYLHWFVRIVPRLNTPAGFELGAGIPVNPSLPENDAEILRNALASPTGERP
jgi:UDPglucose--hexose-1-phosphate uridylyltransferase